jgi:hypothetical protein
VNGESSVMPTQPHTHGNGKMRGRQTWPGLGGSLAFHWHAATGDRWERGFPNPTCQCLVKGWPCGRAFAFSWAYPLACESQIAGRSIEERQAGQLRCAPVHAPSKKEAGPCGPASWFELCCSVSDSQRIRSGGRRRRPRAPIAPRSAAEDEGRPC